MTAYEECLQACDAMQREMKPAVKQIIMRRATFDKLRMEMLQICVYPTAGPYRGYGMMQLASPTGWIDVFTSENIPWEWVAMNENGEPVEHGERVP